MNEALFSSKRDDWGTPLWLYAQLNEAFRFTVDVCANAGNHKHPNYFDIDADGLAQPWEGVCWMNPPYGRAVAAWMNKAAKEAQNGATVVGLVAARTDTRWFQDFATLGHIFFLKGRLTFEGAVDPAPFPSAIIVWYPGCTIRETNYVPASPQGIDLICSMYRFLSWRKSHGSKGNENGDRGSLQNIQVP
ncbi:phage N-6-adenine-methyltransferase [Paenibacillus melissococcoides]|uniref:Phage N-6-adenine-methyltransferase n=1 Tax=Paenibacillus melissococcoides TaxID=2912268 RepID=A0ABN8U4T5_9BACL|nr:MULTISPECIES: DNA N-6-adenine-methyltransferase [Paenibacillus]MEB9893231.1 DNA N-6-adenine-methyltransferase [Bacillus cereus]CAH8246097.1 phage N-6-adenine-methyltransferase [Paenibacillus melissococcoides]CAH8712963.1 phage N-6-adenine-methyltransferase [Paenibacillus melissococcoides]CAH8713701.1 phage N-6-adenine-methyltransferase [Paenibacillus melissococcoides]GIO78702.1 hypothetical protein J6TS7_23120 [Paenibacillus dendritiformis]